MSFTIPREELFMNITRRQALKGLGVSISLPFLESIAWAVDPKIVKNYKSPVRSMFIMIPQGVVMDNWKFNKNTPVAIPKIIQPLTPLLSSILFINGVKHDKANSNGSGAGDHARSAGTFLTGTQCRKTAGTDIETGISIDQVIAQKTGLYTSLPSLELGIEQGAQAGSCDSGYSCAYSSSISWRTSNTPNAKEINPKAVFDRMFNAKKTVKTAKGGPDVDPKFIKESDIPKTLDQSILDLVLEDAQGMRRVINGSDQRKLDEYLDSIRALEKRIEFSQKEARQSALESANKKPGNYSPLIEVNPQGTPKDFVEHVKLMFDLSILAFQTDTTRIITFMMGNEGSNRTYPHIGVDRAHHEISHHQNDPSKLEDLTKINTHHIDLLAYMLQKMNSLNDGKGTLLDNSQILYGSAISDGNSHSHTNLPILVAGKAGGTISTGKVIDTTSNMCDLFLAMAARAGSPLDNHGDSTKMMEI